MGTFNFKGLVETAAQWEYMYQHTRGGDGFPCSCSAPSGDFPVLVFEHENATRHGAFDQKEYLVISKSQILSLLNSGRKGPERDSSAKDHPETGSEEKPVRGEKATCRRCGEPI